MIAAIALVCLLLSPSLALANAALLWESLRARRDINATHFDGNTWLESPTVWNPPIAGSIFSFHYGYKTFGPGSSGFVLLVASKPDFQGVRYGLLDIIQGPDQWYMTVVINCIPQLPPCNDWGQWLITFPSDVSPPNDGLWHGVGLSIDLVSGTGQYSISTEHSLNTKTGNLVFTLDGGNVQTGGLAWSSMDLWSIGKEYKGGLAEIWGDYHDFWRWNGGAVTAFETANGLFLGLDASLSRGDCATVTAGIIPMICNRGNANAIDKGPNVAPSTPGYTMTVTGSGTLTNESTDPCNLKGIGDGCI